MKVEVCKIDTYQDNYTCYSSKGLYYIITFT